jgi:hypothetical protein
MKAVIDHIRYNTDTAEKIGSYDNGYAVSDFKHLSETLYKTKSGQYFLHG